MFVVSQWNIFNLRFAWSSDADAIYDTTQPPTIYLYIYICVIRERISCTFLPAMCITFRIKRHRDDASSSTEIRLNVDTTRSGEECGESSFDVTTYLLVDRPTHPYKQGLLERNRNNLYPKGLGSDRVSLGYYLPAVRFAVCMYTHVFVALSRDSSIFVPREREVYVPSVLLLRNQSTAAACHDHCVSFLLLCFPIGHRDCEFLRDLDSVVVRRES